MICAPEVFQQVSHALEAAKIPADISEISRIPSSTVDLDAADGRRVLKLMEALEDQDDVQHVTANFNIPDEVLAEVIGGL